MMGGGNGSGLRNMGDIQALMAKLQAQNIERVRAFLIRFGISGVVFDAFGGTLCKCMCGSADCSGHAVEFNNRMHYTKRGIESIPRAAVGHAAAEEHPNAEPMEPMPPPPHAQTEPPAEGPPVPSGRIVLK